MTARAKIESPPAEEAFRAAVAAGDDSRILSAIRAWAEEARGAAGAAGQDDDGRLVSEAPEPLAAHPNPKVRQSVAEAADVFPSDAFDAILLRLQADEDHFVRAAITRAAKQRAVRRKARAKDDEQGKVVAELLAEIERRFKEPGRRLAEHAVRRGTEYFVRMLHHEVSKIVTPLEFSLNRLRSEVARPVLDRGALARDVAVAWERYSHLWSIIDRARDATATVPRRFADEALLPIVDEARAQLLVRLGPRAERLAFTSEVDSALRIDLHRTALLQALQNFLQNAVEAYPDDAARLEIRVTARMLRAGSQVEILVTDCGAGMNEEQRDRLFVPFGSRKPGGTGVGLLIARTAIEEVHGGTLTVQSARGAGTTVKLVLPARQTRRDAP